MITWLINLQNCLKKSHCGKLLFVVVFILMKALGKEEVIREKMIINKLRNKERKNIFTLLTKEENLCEDKSSREWVWILWMGNKSIALKSREVLEDGKTSDNKDTFMFVKVF